MARLALFGGLVAFFAITTVDCGAATYITCTGLCESVLPCDDSYQECISFCTKIETRCGNVARNAVFLAYVSCTTDAGFSCPEASMLDAMADVNADAKADAMTDAHVAVPVEAGPVANAPCGIQQAELIQCEPDDADVMLDVPDSAYDPGLLCPDAGSCIACCEAAYPAGAKEYAEAVSACVCGDGGAGSVCTCPNDGGLGTHSCTPAVACATEACGSPLMTPSAGGTCDQCLTLVLDEESPDAGACVLAINRRCQPQLECDLYANCVSQNGCTN